MKHPSLPMKNGVLMNSLQACGGVCVSGFGGELSSRERLLLSLTQWEVKGNANLQAAFNIVQC